MSDNHLEAVIWDLDGVIADTAAYHYGAWCEVFAKRGRELSLPDFMQLFGQRHDTIIKFALGDRIPQKDIDKITEEKQTSYRRRIADHVQPLPGAIELLKLLQKNGIKSALGTSAVPKNVEVVVNKLGIADYFQAIAHGMEVKDSKPSPQLFRLAARKLSVEPGNCVVIEDAIAGVAAAKAAGMKCVAVTNSHPVAKLKNADLVVASLEKVDVTVLRQLFAAK
jgi:beta-phosphoglucomutase family hydrolase